MRIKLQQGLSIVELMVALLIGSFLVLGLVQVFTANKQGFEVQEATSRIQENGRMAIEMLSRDLREAGFMGCANVLAGVSVNNNLDLSSTSSKYTDPGLKEVLSFTGGDAVEVFDNVTASSIKSTSLEKLGLKVGTAAGELVAGTDAVILKGAEPLKGGKVVEYKTGGSGSGTAQFTIADLTASKLVQKDVVVVANCNSADIFGITVDTKNGANNIVHGSDLNVSPKPQGTYDKESYIYRYKTEVFYVAYNAQGEPSLYLRRLVSAAAANPFETLELASGVEDLQFVLGEDTDGDFVANRYLAPGTSGINMNNVVSIKVNILTRSDDGALARGSQTYYFNGASVTASDSRLRAPFQATVALRNRVR
ncbi:MAG: hypothetical protein D6758_13710 [Gammaproteobacteria bacterium]|nr:MAG: hypothetical protein D6758_13710 [Gammaproteobacteria bacterium]